MIVIVATDGTVQGPFPDEDTPATPSFRVDLIGGDGSSWDLTHGPVILTPGAQLFAAPTVTHRWNTSPSVDGSRWNGMRTEQQDVVIPVALLGDDWQSWTDADAAFFRAIHPQGECFVSVTSPDARVRQLGVRFVAGGEVEVDPLANFYAAYTLEFVVANPFWRGEPVTTTFTTQDPVPLFPGPPFSINPSSLLSSSTVSNPGDEPVWPRYTVTGPALSWSVGVDTGEGPALVSSDTPLAVGKSVTIDMDPTQLTVLDQDGNDVYEVLDSDTFSAIPAGRDVPLLLKVAGSDVSTRVQVEFTPLYRRPW